MRAARTSLISSVLPRTTVSMLASRRAARAEESFTSEAGVRLEEQVHPAGIEDLTVDERLAVRRTNRDLGLVDPADRADPGPLRIELERPGGVEDGAEADVHSLRREALVLVVRVAL